METKRTQLKVAMNYGAIYGLSSIAVFLIFYFIGTDVQSKLPQWISYLLLIALIIIGIKSYRDEDLEGYISYGKSLGTGTMIALFGGVITGFFTLLFFTYLAPEMVQRILDETQKNLTENGMSEEQIEMTISYSKKFMTPMWLFFFSILGSAFLGFLFSLIISIFMKKEQNPFNSNIG